MGENSAVLAAAHGVPTGQAVRHVKNLRVWLHLLGPAVRRLLLKRDKGNTSAVLRSAHRTYFNWEYRSDHPELRRLYEMAKRDQWNSTTDLPWDTEVDVYNPATALLDANTLPFTVLPTYRSLPAHRQAEQIHGFAAWLLSQFLHGEQGALFAACEVTEAVHWADGKLYGATQVMDEGRHVETFQRYLQDKLQRQYVINDNLFTIIDALVSDNRWDMKFLGMQIMIEGLALGAFGVMRRHTHEPLLRELLRYIITDEARHVHYGVTALGQYYKDMPAKQRAEREDWAFEVSVLMRNRFLAHEFYDEYYAHAMSRDAWDQMALASPYMQLFRQEMFRRLVPNLKRIHLLSDRIRPNYARLGLLQYESEKAAPELTAPELLS